MTEGQRVEIATWNGSFKYVVSLRNEAGRELACDFAATRWGARRIARKFVKGTHRKQRFCGVVEIVR